jgi:hypothetical protein
MVNSELSCPKLVCLMEPGLDSASVRQARSRRVYITGVATAREAFLARNAHTFPRRAGILPANSIERHRGEMTGGMPPRGFTGMFWD